MDLSDDEAILDRYRESRDPALLTFLLRRYQNRIYNVAYRVLGNTEEAEEIVQDTCIKIHQGILKVQKSASFGAWVFRIVHNLCFDYMRNKQRRGGKTITFDPQTTLEDASAEGVTGIVTQAADPGPGPHEALEGTEEEKVIAEKLNLLPDMQKVVVILHDVEGFSYQQIAEIVGTSIGTVRSRLHYGRVKLKELLEPYYQGNPVSQTRR